MRTKLVGLAIIAFLAACLLWQAEKQGQLKAQIKGHVSAMESMVAYENKQIEQKIKDDQLFAENKIKQQKTARENYELRNQLQQISGCSSNYIDADTIKWVREYRSSD